MEKLQAGERRAILLAESTEADIILLDERIGAPCRRLSRLADYRYAEAS